MQIQDTHFISHGSVKDLSYISYTCMSVCPPCMYNLSVTLQPRLTATERAICAMCKSKPNIKSGLQRFTKPCQENHIKYPKRLSLSKKRYPRASLTLWHYISARYEKSLCRTGRHIWSNSDNSHLVQIQTYYTSIYATITMMNWKAKYLRLLSYISSRQELTAVYDRMQAKNCPNTGACMIMCVHRNRQMFRLVYRDRLATLFYVCQHKIY